MADDRQPNPAQSFSQMVTEWERNFDAFANQVMGTEAYSQAMNEMQKAQLQYQRGMSELMAQQLASLNMPSREDIIELMDMLRQMDQRLEKIETRMALNDKPKSSRARPKRTKQPPSAAAEASASTTTTRPRRTKTAKKKAEPSPQQQNTGDSSAPAGEQQPDKKD